MSETKHFKNYSYIDANMKVHINMDRMNKRLLTAQRKLDVAVMNSMLPYMPLRTGSLQQRTRAQSTKLVGTGVVVAAAPPYGRFQYYGKVMVDPVTGSPWARKGVKKVLDPKGRRLKYSQPDATPEWFETAKQRDLKQWIKTVEDILNGG